MLFRSLSSKHISTLRPSPKLSDRWLGPFEVVAKVNPVAFKLKLPDTLNIHPVFHVSLLRPHTAPAFPEQRSASVPPGPVFLQGAEEWEVEKVLASRLLRGVRHFLVKWKGFPAEESSWQPEEDLRNAPEAVAEFLATSSPSFRDVRPSRRVARS